MNITLPNKRYIFLLVTFLIIASSFANNIKTIDSLRNVINTSNNDSIISFSYFLIAQAELNSNPKQALVNLNKSFFYLQK